MTPPFASVLMRTQGLRERALAQALESLAMQTDPDFELLLLAHGASPATVARIEIATRQHPSLCARTTIVVVDEGGGRSRPLNVGLGRARGSYVTFLDDDDYALEDWIENVRSGAVTAPDTIVRAMTYVQWLDACSGEVRPPARSHHSTTFDLLEHLFENQTPICGYAVPRERVRELGLVFDESLAVVEDWDFLVHAALALRVHDTGRRTSICRTWEGQPNSTSVHSSATWAAATALFRTKLDAVSLRLPPGSSTTLIELQNRRRAHDGALHALAAANERLAVAERDLERVACALERASADARDATSRYLAVVESASWRALRPLHGAWHGLVRLVGNGRSSAR